MVNILAIISNYSYNAKLFNIIQEAETVADHALYVSLNKTYKSLNEEFKRDHRAIDKFMFIDTITATVIDPKPVDNCTFLKSADNFPEMYKEIIRVVKEKKMDMLIFDSLSSMITYQDFSQVDYFVTQLLGALSLLDCSAVFTCLKTDEGNELVSHMRMKCDLVYELS